MLSLLTQVTILNDSTGKKKISYSYDTVDENGNTTKSNQKKSFVVVDESILTAIQTIEDNINTRITE